jgi:predicted metal-dependent peptidase
MSPEIQTQVTRLLSLLNNRDETLAAIYYNLVQKLQFDPQCRTAATDGKTITLGPWVFERTLQEQLYILGHELIHVALDHPARGAAYARQGFGPDLRPWDQTRANRAMDYVVNALLEAAGLGHRPSAALFRYDITPDKAWDVVYADLPPTPPQEDQGRGPGHGHGGFDEHQPYPGDPEDVGEQAERQQALAQALSQGDGTGVLARVLRGLMERQISWTEELRDFMEQAAGRQEYSWRRPNKKSLALAPNIPMPGLSGRQLGRVAITLDVSGSIGQRAFDAFITETAAIFEDLTPDELYFIPWDTSAECHEIEALEDITEAEFRGGGGTDYHCAINLIHELGIEPDVIVCLTDGAAVWPAASEVPWSHVTVTTSHLKCPFGRNICLEVPK